MLPAAVARPLESVMQRRGDSPRGTLARSSTARGYYTAPTRRMIAWIRPRAGHLAPQRPPRCRKWPSQGHSKAARSPAVMPLVAPGRIQHCARLLHGANSPDGCLGPTTGGPPRSPTTPAMLPVAVARPFESVPQPRGDAPRGTLARSSTGRGYDMAPTRRMSAWIRPRADRHAPQRPPAMLPAAVARPFESVKAARSAAVMPLVAPGRIQHCARLLQGANSPDESG